MDFIKSIDWLFLFQLLLFALSCLLGRYLYKHSAWLNTRGGFKINIYRFPRLSSFLDKVLNKENDEGIGFIHIILALIAIPIFFSGVFFILFAVYKTVTGLEKFLSSRVWWEQNLICLCLILFYFGIKIWWDEKRKKSFLSSKKEDASNYVTKNVHQKVSEIDAIRIPTYPRFTIYDLSVEGRENQLIFDSSDFLVINKAFGLLDGSNYNTILNEKYLKFKGEEYLVTKVQVDFLDIFDDYSINRFGGRHTKVYEGRDVPYNIQIIVEVRKT